ncbi:protein FRG2-like-1 [Suncus etruscus]|uniref:protein FRG2-like-1 n=1 Tax=Suncus etruscus TaxID=109475 RepID=UPI0021108C5B|nr:protein FRG2-like-1 [Suncus etruscus]
MEVGKEELHPDPPSKGPSGPQQSFPEKVSPEKGLEMEEKAEGKGPEPKSAGEEKCRETEAQDQSSSTDQSEAECGVPQDPPISGRSFESSSEEDNEDRDWKRKRSRGARSPHTPGSPSEVDHSGKSSGASHPRGPGTLHNGCNEEADRNSCSRRHQRKPQCHGRWRSPLGKRPRSPEPESTRASKCPRLRRGLVTTLRSLSRAIQVDLVETQRQQTCAPLSPDQLALLAQLRAPLTGLVQALYSMASQAAYVFPAEAWMMPQSPRFAQMPEAPSLPAESRAGAAAEKVPTHASP